MQQRLAKGYVWSMLVFSVITGCGGAAKTWQRERKVQSPEGPIPPEVMPPEAALVVSKLRQYCQACHGLGGLRFIRSDDDNQVWSDLHSLASPQSGQLWADAIKKVLNWPSDAPPPFDQLMDPVLKRDWMPKGAKRLQIAEDKVGDQSTRQFILQTL